jgi:phage antirepressor YoqD-like protein
MEVLQQALESEQARIKAEEALALAAPKVEFVDRYVQPALAAWVREVAKCWRQAERVHRFPAEGGLMYRTTPKSAHAACRAHA